MPGAERIPSKSSRPFMPADLWSRTAALSYTNAAAGSFRSEPHRRIHESVSPIPQFVGSNRLIYFRGVEIRGHITAQ